MYKTGARKYYGEAIVVTQEVGTRLLSSPVVKESIINNSDCKILLDEGKYMNKFDQIQALLSDWTEKEKLQTTSIQHGEQPLPRLYKEVWIGLGRSRRSMCGGQREEYLAYTTEETEKVEVYARRRSLGRRHRSRDSGSLPKKAEKQGITKNRTY